MASTLADIPLSARRFRGVLLILLLLGAFSHPAARAADLKGVLTGYTLASWSQKDGLPSAFVQSFAQGADGYLWIGTTAGLYRFDGVRFVPWDRIGTPALPPGPIRALHAARDGSIWVGTSDSGGPAQIRGRVARRFPDVEGVSTSSVATLAEDTVGAIWAGTSAGLFRFAEGQWTKWAVPHRGPDEAISASYVDETGHLFVANAESLLQYQPSGASFVAVAELSTAPRSIAETANGSILIDDGVTGFRIVGSAQRSAFQRARGRMLLRDRRNNIWIGTLGQGLMRLRFDDEERLVLLERATVLTGLLSNGVSGLFEDRDGNIWVGSPEGVTRLSPHKATQITDIGLATGIGATRDGRLWVGTVDALLEFPSADSSDPIVHELPHGARLRLLQVDLADRVWIASEDSSLFRFADGRFTSLRVNNPADRPRRIQAMTADGHAGLWLADAERGLVRWSNGTVTAAAPSNWSANLTVLSAFTDSTGRAWFGLSDGDIAVATDAGVRAFGEREGVDAGVYSAMFEDRRHTIWFAGIGGLTRFVDGRFTTVHSGVAFPLDNLNAITEDDSGHLWIGWQNGIAQVPRDQLERPLVDIASQLDIRELDRSDGLAGFPFAYSSTNSRVARDGDGKLWFVTSRGLTLIDPQGLQPVQRSPAHVESVTADGVRLPVDPGGLSLPAGTASLEFEFTAVNLTSPMKQHFRYMLEGFDREWIAAGGRRQAFYTNLSPRSYRFRVQTSDSETQWMEASESIAVSIAPRFHQTYWFAGLVVLALGFAVGASWRLHVRGVRRQFAMLIGERARLSRELHDTLLQNLVGVALQFDALANDPRFTSSEEQRREFVRLRRRVEGYIREARQSIADLRSPRVGTQDLATALREAGEREVDGRTITLSFRQHGTARSLAAGLEEQVLKIGREAIVNAARHAQADQISVELESSDDALTLRVTDNGKGFDPDAVDSDGAPHYGLTGMRERAEDVGGHLSVESSVGRGTRVEATVPLRGRSIAKRHEPTLH